MRFLQKRQVLALVANVTALAVIAGSGSVVMMRGKPAGAEGRRVDPDSIGMTARLERYEYSLEDSRTVLVTAKVTGKTYLVKDDQTALAGADVRFTVPKYGMDGVMTPARPGEYAYSTTERIRIQAPVPLLQTRGWQVKDLKIELDGKDKTSEVTLTDTKASWVNAQRKDVTGAGLAVFSSPKTYDVKTHSKITFRVVKADGSPAANLTAVISLPDHNYSETISTDANGQVVMERDELTQLSIQGGQMVHVDGPLFIELPDNPDTLFWWEDPTPRCEMAFRVDDKRLAVQPGQTARFGFEIVNKGNRPDDYQLKVDPIPGSTVEVEYDGALSLLPFFGQVVYVNVTPDRVPETKTGTRKVNVTVTSSCDTQSGSSDLKVQEFHQPGVDMFGTDMVPGPTVAPGLSATAEQVGEKHGMHFIVRAAGPLPASAKADVAALGGTVRQELGLIQGLAVDLPAGKLAALSALPWVSHVDEDKPVKALLDHSVPTTGAPKLWDLGYDGSGVIVAVVDTGVDYHHPALKDHVILGPNFADGNNDPMDGYGHGTHVAGIIASRDPVYRGMAPGATIMAVKVLGNDGSGTESSVIAGVDWAVQHGAKVINLSLGAPGTGGRDPLSHAVDNAVRSGAVVVVAAGNGGPDFSTIGSPGDARLALTAGATDNDRNLMSWSSRGPTLDGRQKPDVLAPGDSVTSSVPGGGFDTMSGTSMATPHIAGLAALLVQATHAEPLLIKEGLKKTAIDLGLGPNNSGAGFINPEAALAYVQKGRVVVQKEAFPGDIVAYDFTLENGGNVDDKYRMTQWVEDNGLRYRSQSTLPDGAIRTFINDKIASGAATRAQAQVSVPKDWAGMEDTIYVFHLQATSLADRNAVDQDRATLKVKATKDSMARFASLKTTGMKSDTAGSSLRDPVKTDLTGRVNAILDQEQLAVQALAARQDGLSNGYLDQAQSLARDLDAQLQRYQATGRILAADGQRLRQQVADLISQLAITRAAKAR
ncbi:MAG TPA: S8 family serine peptidase [Symbiobacteriaceae bacterium]|jgi:subtilisin family serine protease